MNVTYRLVGNSDVEYIVTLDKLMRSEEPEVHEEYHEERYRTQWEKYPIDSNHNGDIIVCFDNDEIIGRVDVIYEQSYLDFSIVGYVDWIYVRPSYRKKGIGKALLQEAEKLFVKKGCFKYYLFVAENKQAIAFYEKTDLDITVMRTAVKKLEE